MPGRSRTYVAGSVPDILAKATTPSNSSGFHTSSRSKLYSKPPLRCCSSVSPALKSKLKSPPNDEAHGKVQPIRFLKACSFASGAREIVQNITSWLIRCGANPLYPSAIAEQDG